VMDRRLVSGTVAALAAILLGTGGGTFAAFDDASDVPDNQAASSLLLLDLGSDATLTFAGLEPGAHTANRMWVATNESQSGVPAEVSVTVRHLVDRPGPCDTSTGKAEGDITSGIPGCTIDADGSISGVPRRGVASRMLDVSASYVPSAVDPHSCGTTAPGTSSLLPTSGPGDLRAAAIAHHGAGTTTPVVDDQSRPVRLAPGQGVCVLISAYWPPDVTDAAHASPDHPVDNAAQGDSFSVEVRFDLTQVAS
jgi:predicted ribosomally synthesized peptide with SipW-like signal peptide